MLGTAKSARWWRIARAVYNKARSHHLRRADRESHARGDHTTSSIWCATCAGVASAIIYISHALEESLQISDPQHRSARRQAGGDSQDGGHDPREAGAATWSAATSPRRTMRVPPGGPWREAPAPRAERRLLTVENVTMGMVVKNMSFSVICRRGGRHRRPIGSGRHEIAKVIFGALKRNLINGGTIKLRGEPVRYRVPKQANRCRHWPTSPRIAS